MRFVSLEIRIFSNIFFCAIRRRTIQRKRKYSLERIGTSEEANLARNTRRLKHRKKNIDIVNSVLNWHANHRHHPIQLKLWKINVIQKGLTRRYIEVYHENENISHHRIGIRFSETYSEPCQTSTMKRFVKIIKGFWQGSWVCLFLYNTWPNNPDDEVPNRFVFSKWIQGKTEVIFKNLQTHEFLPGDYKHIAKTFQLRII